MFALRLCKSLPRPIRTASVSSHARAAPVAQPLSEEQRAERRATREARRAAREASGAERLQPLAIEGSVRHYQRHFMVVETQYGADSWPKKLERSPAHLVGKYVGAIAHALGGDIRKSPLLVTAGMKYTGACRGPAEAAEEEHETPSSHDILVFPENLRVFNVDAAKSTFVDTLALAALENDLNIRELLNAECVTVYPGNLRFEELNDAMHVLVCAHTQRDERCGCKGPELLEWLRETQDAASPKLNLWISSHYGGHRYAANCIVYPSGDWFGMLNEQKDALSLLDAVHAGEPLRLRDQWRGRIGLTEEQQMQAVRDAIATVHAD